MKNVFAIILVFVSYNALISCGQSKQEKEAPVETNSSSLMKESTYDATKIDPSAPISEVNLHATGNNMSEMKFDLSEIKVKAGSTVKLNLINQAKDASMQHNFLLIDEGTADSVAAKALKAGPDKNYIPDTKEVYVGTAVTLPGNTTTISFPAPDKGSYEFICSYPGHYKMMRGKFIVE